MQPYWNDSKLDIINKMALLRNGNVPISIVVLKGKRENVEFVAKKESEILGNYFAILKKNGTPAPGKVNFVPVDIDNSDISWLNEKHEVIDADTLYVFDWDAFFAVLGLENASKDTFSDFTMEMKRKLESNMDSIVADVLYAHYEKCDNNIITEDDINMIRAKVSKAAKEPKHDSKDDAAQKEAPKYVKKTQIIGPNEEKKQTGDITPLKDSMKGSTGDVSNDKKIFSNEAMVGRGDRVAVVEDTNLKKEVQATEKPVTEEVSEELVKETPVEPNDVLEQNDDSAEIIPAPAKTTKKDSKYTVKEELTDEEKAANDAMLEKLRSVYNDTIRYMEETCNSKYRILINKMQEAVDKNIYKIQFTKEYLKDDDDTSTELYRRLYELDLETQKFTKNVVHQIKHIACFSCNTEWDEDITFLPSGYHKVRCPKCFSDYPFEK